MKRLAMTEQRKVFAWTVMSTVRRLDWFTDQLTWRRAANLALAVAEFLARREVMRAWPVAIKVDISPLCNLKCTVCVHATPDPGSHEDLHRQHFRSHQRMSLDAFRRIVDEVAPRTSALSLYYLGDPLMHPELAAMCRYASGARLNTHVSTNLSFDLDDAQIDELVQSGLTHLTVCVDGLSQTLYERTRVGGRIDVVLDNLARILRRRRALGRRFPRVEVQFIKFQHNVHERAAAIERFAALGVDRFTDFWGGLFNYTDLVAGKAYRVLAPKPAGAVPRCFWPHFAMVVKYDGDVIPCCNYRHGAQYQDGRGDARVLGNASASGVRAIWNSPAYRALRRLVSDPRRAAREPALTHSFCSGCPTVCETDVGRVQVRADRVRWEDRYERGARGRVRLRVVGT